jgi:hypothetical protein
MFDKIFKTLLLIIAFGFLTIYCLSNDNHRYSMQWGKDDSFVTVFDSKTGKLYIATEKEGWLVHDPIKKASPLKTNHVFPSSLVGGKNDAVTQGKRPPLSSFDRNDPLGIR